MIFLDLIKPHIFILYIFILSIGFSNACITATTSENCEKVYYKDFDRDRFSDGITSCSQDPGFYSEEELISTFGDCDDTNNMVYPDSPTQSCPIPQQSR
ncbi:MAG: hypothetical protein NZ927_00295 [Candidatus Calescibacterium sp.]|nr:hypothetical protein [Candidatus Calescibacterium sp.]MCX7733810.1 hypothetical protein [bacterium]MDW8086984.1 hypothetical protein [Candidatus Calescibacterium sp.]